MPSKLWRLEFFFAQKTDYFGQLVNSNRTKLGENTKIWKFKCDILCNFQTLLFQIGLILLFCVHINVWKMDQMTNFKTLQSPVERK